jgi:hypothetical protein
MARGNRTSVRRHAQVFLLRFASQVCSCLRQLSQKYANARRRALRYLNNFILIRRFSGQHKWTHNYADREFRGRSEGKGLAVEERSNHRADENREIAQKCQPRQKRFNFGVPGSKLRKSSRPPAYSAGRNSLLTCVTV